MTDAIRRSNVSINSSTETTTSQAENTTETKNVKTQPTLGYANVRDSFESAKSAINQNSTPTDSEAAPKVDARAADQLNRQLLSARMTPYFGQAAKMIAGDVTSDQKRLSQQLSALKEQKEGLQGSILKQNEKLHALETGSAQQAEVAEKIANIDKQIAELQEDIKALKGKIKELQTQLAETDDPAIKARIRAEIEKTEDQIKQKDAQIQSLKEDAQELKSGEQTDDNTRTPSERK